MKNNQFKVSHSKSASDKSSPNLNLIKQSNSRLTTKEIHNKRNESFEANSSSRGSRTRKAHAVYDKISKYAHVDEAKRESSAWGALPHSNVSSRNINNERLNKYTRSKQIIKNTMNIDKPNLKLENSQEAYNYMAIGHNQKSQISKTKDIDFNNDCDTSHSRKPKKSITKPKRQFNDRFQNTASIYK